MNTTFSQIHGMVQLPPMDARITLPPEDLKIVLPKLQTSPTFPPSPKSLPDTLYPDTPSSTTSSSRKRQRRRSSSSRSRQSRSNASQQAYGSSRLLFQPRAFEELYIERAYLDQKLREHSYRASDLMRRYCGVEQQLQTLDGDHGRRKLRKHLSLLRSKINQAAEQERAIFSRLGDLYVEIQSRETWAQAWTVDSPSVASSICFSPASSGFPTPTTPFVGSSMDFAPTGYFNNFYRNAGPCYSYAPSESAVYGLETVDEAAEDLLCVLDSSSVSVESETAPTTPATSVATDVHPSDEKNDCGSDIGDALDDVRFSVAGERRMSLPCLRHTWSEA
ncbi:hypothetical protein NW752_004474 [Fusarium irregulare]|uniref:Uncharacterized protein n=1 Tax=Fusarium irregulare TaxID=2494466 RepID=A0A9W8U801_9HYPO|nr:hypothetical protein NW766_007381 [Fusarium irregulare]KAJ4021466.1 hypothetical protein NW752_004474 [Fusarium irregulare]